METDREGGGKKALWIRLQIGQDTPTKQSWRVGRESESGTMSLLWWLCN